MSAQPKLMSDLEGLAHQVDPLSRRGFFLATSAAAAAGYTLAAGPVRADAIKTDTDGLTTATPRSRSPTARCRFTTPAPPTCRIRP